MNDYAGWKQEEAKAFYGWDFSYLDGRWEEEHLPWDYKTILLNYLKPSDRLLDMGTGGGEFLLSLGHSYPKTSVSESFEPNVRLCFETLAPLGIEVKQVVEDEHLPFEDNTFDIIINRHESYCLEEVKRLLKPNGWFITQQVGGHNNETLSNFLITNFEPQFATHTLHHALEAFDKNDFDVQYAEEYFPSLKFKDIGALVYFAKIIEWEFPNFSVDNCYDKLCLLQQQLSQIGYIESKEHRYICVCQNRK